MVQGGAKEQETLFIEFIFCCESHIHREGMQGNPSGFLTGTMVYQWYRAEYGGFYKPIPDATRSVSDMGSN